MPAALNILLALPLLAWRVSHAPRLRLLATLALFYCAAIWGSTFFVVKQAVEAVDPQLLVGYRFVLAAILLVPLAIWTGGRKTSAGLPVSSSVLPGLFLGIILWVLYATQTAGLSITTASNSGFITGLFIVFVPFFHWLFAGRRPGAWQLLAVGIAVAGLALLTGGLVELNAGDALTLVAALTYAWHVLLSDRYTRLGHRTVWLCLLQMGVAGGLGFVGAKAVGAAIAPLPPWVQWQIVFLTLFPTISAFYLQLWAQRLVEPLRVALIFTLEPVFGALFAWTLGGEPFQPMRALGGLVMVAAMLISELGPGNTARDTP